MHLILSKRSLRLSSVLFILFTLFCSLEVISTILDFPAGSDGKTSAYSLGDPGLIPGSGRSSGEGNGTQLQYSCLEIPWREEHGRLQSVGFKELDMTEQIHFHFLSTILSSSSLISSSASDILLLISSRVFLISVIVLFVSVCLFF